MFFIEWAWQTGHGCVFWPPNCNRPSCLLFIITLLFTICGNRKAVRPAERGAELLRLQTHSLHVCCACQLVTSWSPFDSPPTHTHPSHHHTNLTTTDSSFGNSVPSYQETCAQRRKVYITAGRIRSLEIAAHPQTTAAAAAVDGEVWVFPHCL